jgi:hypothetical protein
VSFTLEFRYTLTYSWLPASFLIKKVVDLRPSDAASLRIHFMGYKKTHQRWADPTGADSGHPVMPAHTHTPVPPPAPPRTPKSVNSPPPSPSKTQLLAAAAAAAAAADTEAKAAAAVPTTTNRFGRAVPKAFVPKAVAAARRAENHEDDGTAAGEAASGAASGASNGGGSGGEGKSASGGGGAASDDLNDWYCSVCMAFEREDAQEDDVLLSCDGPCLRSFHVNCLGLDAVPEDEVTYQAFGPFPRNAYTSIWCIQPISTVPNAAFSLARY